VPNVSAEQAYLFRHAVLRDAAYQLQVPADRAILHRLALFLIEAALGGRPPLPPPLTARALAKVEPHPIDSAAGELAWHALQAIDVSQELAEPARLYLHRAAEYSARQYRAAEAATHWQALSKLLSGPDKAEALRRAGDELIATGDVKAAEAILDEALALSAQTNDGRITGSVLAELAGLYEQTGRSALSEQTYLRALDCLDRAGDRYRHATTEVNLAILCTQTGQMARAQGLFERGIEVIREFQDSRGLGVALQNFATLLERLGKFAHAQTVLEQAMEVQRQSSDERREASLQAALGLLAKRSGRMADAEAAQKRSLELHRRHGDRRIEGFSWGSLAALYTDTGRTDQAEHAFGQALTILREVGDTRAQGAQLSNLASLYHQTGRLGEAAELLEQAMAIHRQVGNRRFEGITLGNIALLQTATGRHDEADRTFEEAMAIHRQVGNQRMLGVQLCEYAIALVTANQTANALAKWKAGTDLLNQLGDGVALSDAFESMRATCVRVGVPPLDAT